MSSVPDGMTFDDRPPPATDPDVGYRAAVRQRLIAAVLVVLIGGGAVFGYAWYSRVELAHVFGGSDVVIATVTDTELVSRSAGRYGTRRLVLLITVSWDDDGHRRSNTLEESADSPLTIGATAEVSVIPGSDAISDLGVAGAWWRLFFVVVALGLWLLWVVIAWRQYRGWRHLFERIPTAPWVYAAVQGSPGGMLWRGTARKVLIYPRPGTATAEPISVPVMMGITLHRRASGQQLDGGEEIVIWICGRSLIRNRPVSPLLVRSQANGSWFVASGTFPRRAAP